VAELGTTTTTINLHHNNQIALGSGHNNKLPVWRRTLGWEWKIGGSFKHNNQLSSEATINMLAAAVEGEYNIID
jgi:hypothetical protein